MASKIMKTLAVACLLLPFNATLADEFGNISFPNSGSEAAQPAFLRGVKALHSFQFDEARFAFEEAQEIDPDFALAYWGQAMSDNHPLWAQQDGEAATAALNRLAPTHEERLAKAPTEKEKAYLEAIDILYYSEGDKLARDIAYSEYMASMQERWPDDHEIAIFHSLSLLGTMRRGDRGYRRQAKAASIALKVFDENPNHPGAAHFIIHSFDDPDHAILAYPAAVVYADIAPASAHALHMPSHIFLQLGMWQEVVNSNIEAFDAATATNKKYGLAEGREDFHTLSWLAYANLMLGHVDKAEKNLATALDTVERNKGDDRIYGGYLDMRARHMIESGQWEAHELAPMDHVEGKHAEWVAAIGMSAAHLGDMAGAKAASDRLKSLSEKAEADGETYNARLYTVLEQEVTAVRSMKRGDMDGAVAAARNAAEMERQYLRVPSGPPRPTKPAGELYADMLLAANRPDAAMAAYGQSLEWIPQRTPSMRGMAMAAEKAGDGDTAKEMQARLKEMPGAKPMD